MCFHDGEGVGVDVEGGEGEGAVGGRDGVEFLGYGAAGDVVELGLVCG